MSGKSGEALIAIVAEVLRHAPEWLRHDLGAREPSARLRAEETLAAMIAAALADGPRPSEGPNLTRADVIVGRIASDQRPSG